MGYTINDKKEVKFNYILTEGVAERSYATNVARLANLDEKIIKKAE